MSKFTKTALHLKSDLEMFTHILMDQPPFEERLQEYTTSLDTVINSVGEPR